MYLYNDTYIDRWIHEIYKDIYIYTHIYMIDMYEKSDEIVCLFVCARFRVCSFVFKVHVCVLCISRERVCVSLFVFKVFLFVSTYLCLTFVC